MHTQGGYNLTSIARSMTAICQVLLGDALPRLEDDMVIDDKLVVVLILYNHRTCDGCITLSNISSCPCHVISITSVIPPLHLVPYYSLLYFVWARSKVKVCYYFHILRRRAVFAQLPENTARLGKYSTLGKNSFPSLFGLPCY